MSKDNKNTIKYKVHKYFELRKQKKILENEMNTLSKEIKEYSTEKGVKDNKGNYYVTNDNFIFGSVARKSVKLNEDKAKELLKEKGVYSKAIDIVEKVNQDKIEQLVSAGDLTLEDIENITDIKTSYMLDVKEKEEAKEESKEMPKVKTLKLKKKMAKNLNK